jgi:hypothetical protein
VHFTIDVVRLLLLLQATWLARLLAEISQGMMEIDRGSGTLFT